MRDVKPETPKVSEQNHAKQKEIIGGCAHIGRNSNAKVRSSTRAGNTKLGINLVERGKDGAAYCDPVINGNIDLQSDEEPKK